MQQVTNLPWLENLGITSSRLTRLVSPNPSSGRTMQITEQTFRDLKEHASHYYSSPDYDEVLINLVRFYEQNDGQKYYND